MSRWDWERSFRDAKLERGPKLVGFVMATYGDANGEDIYPSMASLATACGVNVKTVRKYRDELLEAGWLECIHGRGGRGLSNRYRLSLPAQTAPPSGLVTHRDTRPQTWRLSDSKPDQATSENPTTGRPETRPPGGSRPEQDQTRRPETVAEQSRNRPVGRERARDDRYSSKDKPTPTPPRAPAPTCAVCGLIWGHHEGQDHAYEEPGLTAATAEMIARLRPSFGGAYHDNAADPVTLNPSLEGRQSRPDDSEAWQSRRRETGTTPAVEKSPAGMRP